MFLFLQAGSFGNGDCGDAIIRRDFATLLQEIFFGEQAEKDICFEGRCGTHSLPSRGIHVCKAASIFFASISLLGVFGSPSGGLRMEGGGRTRRRRGGGRRGEKVDEA